MVLMAASGGVVTTIGAGASSTAAGSGSSTAGVSFLPDGTITGSQVYGGDPNWYRPTTTNVGANYWISFDGGAWQQLNSGRTTSLTGTNSSVSRSVRIATDSGGVNIVATGTVTLMVSNGA